MWPWERKEIRQARRFAIATGGTFVKHSRAYRKENGVSATVYLHGTAAGLNTRQEYASQTGQGYGSQMSVDDQDASQTVNFRTGHDYSNYFSPPDLILANSGAVAAVGVLLEGVLVATPLVGVLMTGNEEINTEAVVNDIVETIDSDEPVKKEDSVLEKKKSNKRGIESARQKEVKHGGDSEGQTGKGSKYNDHSNTRAGNKATKNRQRKDWQDRSNRR
jgi:hypothetical protein